MVMVARRRTSEQPYAHRWLAAMTAIPGDRDKSVPDEVLPDASIRLRRARLIEPRGHRELAAGKALFGALPGKISR